MNTETLYEVADGVATVTLNRPGKRNAWTMAMAQEASHWMNTAEADDDVRVIVLTGAGGGFCAGADMSLLTSVIAGGLNPGGVSGRRAPLPTVSKPVIGAVDGPAVGLGLALALYCDLRIASEAARFGTAFARRGLVAEFGLAWLLPRIVGLGNANDMLLTARLVDAADAYRMSLVNRVLPTAGFQAAVHAFAAEIAAGVSPRSARIIKSQIGEGLSQSLAEAFEISGREMVASLTCDDFKEGVAHFLEKRAPRFTGR
ncbi:MAG TPA: enoyl-CoA hydratase-related protein [Bryobacteraceae bacterium]|nr:enoyl-CoA hydratase-related protein [Bryobacteraceae bacterium]